MLHVCAPCDISKWQMPDDARVRRLATRGMGSCLKMGQRLVCFPAAWVMQNCLVGDAELNLKMLAEPQVLMTPNALFVCIEGGPRQSSPRIHAAHPGSTQPQPAPPEAPQLQRFAQEVAHPHLPGLLKYCDYWAPARDGPSASVSGRPPLDHSRLTILAFSRATG